eukprot:10250156-Alexandrium_andersonii.AAC.1
MRATRQAWAGVVACLGVHPVVLAQRSSQVELRAAVPEILLNPPSGVLLALWHSGKDVFHRHTFAAELAADVGTVARDASEARWALRELAALLAEPVPVYIEDDDPSG